MLRGDDGGDTIYGRAGNDLLLGEQGKGLAEWRSGSRHVRPGSRHWHGVALRINMRWRQAMNSTQEAVRVRARTPAIVALGDKVSVGLRTGSRRTLPSMDVDPTCPICGEPLLVSGARIIVQYRTEDSWQGIHEDCGGSSEGAAG